MDQAKRLKELERENTGLKKLVADQGGAKASKIARLVDQVPEAEHSLDACSIALDFTVEFWQ